MTGKLSAQKIYELTKDSVNKKCQSHKDRALLEQRENVLLWYKYLCEIHADINAETADRAPYTKALVADLSAPDRRTELDEHRAWNRNINRVKARVRELKIRAKVLIDDYDLVIDRQTAYVILVKVLEILDDDARTDEEVIEGAQDYIDEVLVSWESQLTD